MSIQNFVHTADQLTAQMQDLIAQIKSSDGSNWTRLNCAYCELHRDVTTFGAELFAQASVEPQLEMVFMRFRARMNKFEHVRCNLAKFASKELGTEVTPTELLYI